jgi:hypothetical protein
MEITRLTSSDLPKTGDFELTFTVGRDRRLASVFLEFDAEITGSEKLLITGKDSSGVIVGQQGFVPGDNSAYRYHVVLDEFYVFGGGSIVISFDSSTDSLTNCTCVLVRT